jgi:hypothetical protein
MQKGVNWGGRERLRGEDRGGREHDRTKYDQNTSYANMKM